MLLALSARRIHHPEGGLAFDQLLQHGDLLLFPRMWEHEVPEPSRGDREATLTTEEVLLGGGGEGGGVRSRLNLTFRLVHT